MTRVVTITTRVPIARKPHAFLSAPFSSAAAGGGAASTGLEQGTKRKRDGQSDDDENGAHEEGVDDAAPLC